MLLLDILGWHIYGMDAISHGILQFPKDILFSTRSGSNGNTQKGIMTNTRLLQTKCHFDAWAKLGMNLGTMDYQVLATEGWGGASGSSNYTITG